MDLLLSQDGTWEILTFEPEPDTLTGDWSGSTYGWIDQDFLPMTCITEVIEVSLTQNGNEVTGEATFVDSNCHAGQSGTIIGSVRDIHISFDPTLEDETVLKFVGTIAHDFCALGGSYSRDVTFGEEFGQWALSCQK